jgi:glycosyltransferase involved in cell wall biosynthesis
MSTSASQFAIVVPVYNVIQYLPEFLDSLDKQTSKAFFVIAVDDGSTDRGGLVLDRFSAAHPWLTVVHLPNAGVSAARNRGLDIVSQVKGVKYLSFVDPDDVLDPEYVASFTESLERTGADLALCLYTDFDRKKETPKVPNLKEIRLDQNGIGAVFFGYEATKAEAPYSSRGLPVKCFRYDKIRDYRFDARLGIAEDQEYFIRILPGLKTAVTVPQYLYRRRLRKSSITHSLRNDSAGLPFLRRFLERPDGLPPAAVRGIERTLVGMWWAAVRFGYGRGDSKALLEADVYYSWIRKYKFSSPLPAQDKKRILFYALGRYILTPYLRFRERDKPRKTKDLFD